MDAVASLLGLAALIAFATSIYAAGKILHTETPLMPRMLMAASVACAPMAALCLLNFVASWMIDPNAPCSDMLSCSAKVSLENVVAKRWVNFGMAALGALASVGTRLFARHLLAVDGSNNADTAVVKSKNKNPL